MQIVSWAARGDPAASNHGIHAAGALRPCPAGHAPLWVVQPDWRSCARRISSAVLNRPGFAGGSNF